MRVAHHSKGSKGNLSGICEPDAIEPASLRSVAALADAVPVVSPGRSRGVARVPAHRPARRRERRAYVRARLALPLQICRIAGQRYAETPALRTKDISSSGVYFLSPRRLDPGTPLELRVVLVDRPLGRASVTMRTEAHVVRADDASRPGWHGVAVSFDEISFSRVDPAPGRSRAK